MADTKTKPAGSGASSGGRGEFTPSELDELTHHELCLLYEETSSHIIFAKTQQWRTFGATLVIFAVLLAFVKFVSREQSYMQFLVATVILITLTAISVLIIYQFWQHTERQKLAAIAHHFSSLFRKIHGYKHKREAAIHRYLLLVFMIIGLIMGASIVYMGMLRSIYSY
jgi:hypothetical protein